MSTESVPEVLPEPEVVPVAVVPEPEVVPVAVVPEPEVIPETTIVPVPEPAPVPVIATMDELMASHAVIVAQEAADRATLAPLLNPTREAYRPQLFAWASAGFPGIYVVQSFPFTPPSVCSDGVTRDVTGYAWYLLGVEIESVLATIQSMLTGIVVSYSFQGNVLRIHVSKA
jgi:hypothetical protein